jgi:hypothetical protein
VFVCHLRHFHISLLPSRRNLLYSAWSYPSHDAISYQNRTSLREVYCWLIRKLNVQYRYHKIPSVREGSTERCDVVISNLAILLQILEVPSSNIKTNYTKIFVDILSTPGHVAFWYRVDGTQGFNVLLIPSLLKMEAVSSCENVETPYQTTRSLCWLFNEDLNI